MYGGSIALPATNRISWLFCRLAHDLLPSDHWRV